MAYDSKRGKLVLFGGLVYQPPIMNIQMFDDTWEYECCKLPTLYGRGTPHCNGEPQISGNSCPSIGNPNFAVDVQNALPCGPNTLAFMWLGVQQANTPLACANNPALSFTVNLVPVVAVSVPCAAPGSTSRQLPVPIPSLPILVGQNLFFQFLQAEFPTSCTQCGFLITGLTGSKGLDVLIQ